jgi:octaprenyl-diphosphate synthase
MHPTAARRVRPAGVLSGAPLTRIEGPAHALGLVAAELAQAELRLRDLVVTDVQEIPQISRYLVDAGGKRLRPALTALGAKAVGADKELPTLMCVGELIHLGSLLHDDVVDEAQERRGKPAAHHVHGNAATVLSGDYCLARAVLCASEVGGHLAVTALARAVTEMAEGEVLQLRLSGNLGSTEADYFDVIQRKSAALIAWCSAAGALQIGQEDFAEALACYGSSVGIAFQITDDVLDYKKGTGKQNGADLKEQKITLPLMYAMDTFDELRPELEAGPMSAERVTEWVNRIRTSEVLPASLEKAREFVLEGQESLNRLPESEAREALAVLGAYLVERLK